MMTNRFFLVSLYLLLALSLALLIINVAGIVDTFTDTADTSELLRQCWLTLCTIPEVSDLRWSLYGVLMQNIYALVTFLIMVTRAPAPFSTQHKFLALFVTSNLLQSLRSFQIMTISGAFEPSIGLLITRVAVFAYTLGTTALFISSTGAFVRPRKNLQLLIVICVVMSFGIAYRIPIDQFLYAPNLTNHIGKVFELQVAFLVINTIILLNAGHRFFSRRKRYTSRLHALALTIVLVGFQFIFYLFTPLLIVVGIAMLFGGTTLFIHVANARPDR